MSVRTRVRLSPGQIVITHSSVAVKRRPGVTLDALDQTMFDRIPVDVIDAPLEIIFVADRVLPEPPLPDGSFTTGDPGGALGALSTPGGQESSREGFLDLGPSGGIVGVSARQTPDGVQVIGHQHPRDRIERTSDLR